MSFLEQAIRAAEAAVKPLIQPFRPAIQAAIGSVQNLFPMIDEDDIEQIDFAQIVSSAESKAKQIVKTVSTEKATAIGVGAAIAGAGAAAIITRRKKAPKKKVAKKKVKAAPKIKSPKKKAPKKKAAKKKSKGSHRIKEPHKHKGGKDVKHRIGSGELVHFTKRGQPFIIDNKTKKAKFIKRTEVK
ncbi:MAG: hypothetical protein ACREBU_05290 [Nitrososphaera sp.]